MNKNHKKLLSWSETWKLNKRAYILLYKRCSKMILSRMLYIIWTALAPYVTIYLSALIITELSSTRSQQRLTELVLITLLSTALIAIVSALLSKWRNSQCAGLYYNVQHIFTEKIMDMDFCDVDDTKIHQLYNTIEQNRNGGGWGLQNVYTHVENAMSALLTLLGGIALTISLFTIPVPSRAGYLTTLNNPLFILIIILLMFIIICIPPILSTKAESYYALNANSHNLGNRLFGYFGWLGHKTQYAADVRIYRQDLICDKYNTNKTGIFNSKGIFAKLAKGPIGFYKATKKCRLFANINDVEIQHILNCLSSITKEYKKGEYIIHSGAKLNCVSLVLSGKVHIQKEDYWGNQSILTVINESDVFCEAYACLPHTQVSINAVAVTDCTIMFLDLNHIITTCSSACKFHITLIHNLISLIASKNMMLTDKLEHLTQRTTGNKVLSYLSQYSKQCGSDSFEIPFNRQQLADYLSVDRSALSNELCKLRDKGIIDFNKSKFTLLRDYQE